MATYLVTVTPRPGQDPDPSTRPMGPSDFTANNEAEALAQASAIISDDAQPYEHNGIAGTNNLAELQWIIKARRVNRPTVDLAPRVRMFDKMDAGGTVGQHLNYGWYAKALSFFVLIDGIVSGRLERRARIFDSNTVMLKPVGTWKQHVPQVWFIADAVGPLASLSHLHWHDNDDTNAEEWPEAALAGIRAALEGASAGQ